MSLPLPLTRPEMLARGWDSVDVVFVTGDAYVDHPSFAAALLARVLEADGFRVAILAQPDWHSAEPWTTFGPPNLAFCVSAGNMDSMVNHYTANRKVRNSDAYSPDGKIGLRPDRATLSYCQRAREAATLMNMENCVVIAGGVEASLRRLAHYDYWSDKLRRSIVLDSKADLLVYGMGEMPLLDILRRLRNGESMSTIKNVRGTAYRLKKTEDLPEETETTIHLPSWEEVEADKSQFAKMTRLIYENLNPYLGVTLVQENDLEAVVVNPPALPMETAELDRIYALPFTRLPHPHYGNQKIPAYETIKHSIQIHRGCFGGCTFCSLTAHQGKIIQSRSVESVVEEAKQLVHQKVGCRPPGGNVEMAVRDVRKKVQAVQKIQKEIQKMLFEDWDPIGVNGDLPYTEGEYDRYADKIVSIMFNSLAVDESKIREHLRNAMYDNMGLSPHSELEDKTELVVKKLVSFWQSHFSKNYESGNVGDSRLEHESSAEYRTQPPGGRLPTTITDLGGPTANMYALGCKNESAQKRCRRLSCLAPTRCPHLQTDHSALIKLMRAVRKIEGINKVYIASGIRTDLALCDERYVQELVEHHTGGHLSTAPEHAAPEVLELMNKPPIEHHDRFCSLFASVSKKLGKEQYIVPYLMAGFPGTTLAMTIETAMYLKRNGIRSEQVQEFVPGPFELATCMYYTGLNPITGQPVYVPFRHRERRQQKALLMYDDPNSYHDIKMALKEAGREDLIGTGEDCLIPPYPPKSLSMRRSSRVKRLQTQNEAGKKQKEERRQMFAEKMRQEDEERREKLREERQKKREEELRKSGKFPQRKFTKGAKFAKGSKFAKKSTFAKGMGGQTTDDRRQEKSGEWKKSEGYKKSGVRKPSGLGAPKKSSGRPFKKTFKKAQKDKRS